LGALSKLDRAGRQQEAWKCWFTEVDLEAWDGLIDRSKINEDKPAIDQHSVYKWYEYHIR
jgi:hypothetical protein